MLLLSQENSRLRGWLQYIADSDSSVVPGGFHETMAERALKGEKAPKGYDEGEENGR